MKKIIMLMLVILVIASFMVTATILSSPSSQFTVTCENKWSELTFTNELKYGFVSNKWRYWAASSWHLVSSMEDRWFFNSKLKAIADDLKDLDEDDGINSLNDNSNRASCKVEIIYSGPPIVSVEVPDPVQVLPKAVRGTAPADESATTSSSAGRTYRSGPAETPKDSPSPDAEGERCNTPACKEVDNIWSQIVGIVAPKLQNKVWDLGEWVPVSASVTRPTTTPRTPGTHLTPSEKLEIRMVSITGNHMVTNGMKIDPDVLPSLQKAVESFYEKTGQTVRITSGFRSMRTQGRLFWENCIHGKEKWTCSLLTSRAGIVPYLIRSGMTQEETINLFLKEGVIPRNPGHLNGKAVDLWPEGASNYIANNKLMARLQDAMYANGFCRDSEEGWHYAFQKPCRHPSGVYTYTRGDRVIDPFAGRSTDDFNYR